MSKWKDMLEKEHFDINDLIAWTDSQAVRCDRNDYKVIYKKFSRLLTRLKEDRRRIFDERSIVGEKPESEISIPPVEIIPQLPKIQRVKHKIKSLVSLETYKNLLRK